MINSVERMAEAIVEQPFLTEINNFFNRKQGEFVG